MAVFRRLIGAGAGGVPNCGAGSKLGIGLMLLYYTTPRDRQQLLGTAAGDAMLILIAQ